MVPFIGAGISLISGAIDNLFTGEGRERRQARRLARREKRAAKRAGQITVKQPARKVPYYQKAAATQADIKAAPKKPVGLWVQENWYFIAGAGAVILLIVWMTTKKKSRSVRRRKRNPGNPSSKSSSNPSKKSSTGGTFATRTRRVNREWKKAKASGSKIGRKAAWAKWG